MIKTVIAIGLLVTGLVSGVTPASATQQRRTYTGTIDGADYRVELPEHWNGDLVVYSHGYFPPGFDPGQIGLANRGETEGWLLDHGCALAASDFKGRSGAVYDQGHATSWRCLTGSAKTWADHGTRSPPDRQWARHCR